MKTILCELLTGLSLSVKFTTIALFALIKFSGDIMISSFSSYSDQFLTRYNILGMTVYIFG